MGLRDVSGKDKETLRKLLSEAFASYGTNAKLYEPVEESQNSVGDESYKLDSPILVSILFDENPKAKMVKLGWNTEGNETPVIAYILPIAEDGAPVLVKRGALVRVPYVGFDDSYRDFFVGEVRSDSLNNICWVCKLSQNRPQSLLNPTTGEEVSIIDIIGNNFFKGTKL